MHKNDIKIHSVHYVTNNEPSISDVFLIQGCVSPNY